MPLSSATGAGLAKEASYKAGGAPDLTIPLTGTPQFNVVYEAIIDTGRRDSIPAMDFNAYQGVGRSDIGLEGMFYPNELGHLLLAIMGRDTVSETVVPPTLGPATNAFTGNNEAAAETARDTFFTANAGVLAQYNNNTELHIRLTFGSTIVYQHRNDDGNAWVDADTDSLYSHAFTLAAEAPSYVWEFQQPVQTRRYPGARASSFGLNFNAGEGAVTWNANFMGALPTEHTMTDLTDATEDAFLGWEGDVTVGGAAFDRLISMEMTVERGVELLYTANNTQDPSRADQGRMQVTANLMVDYAADEDYERFLNFVRNGVSVSFARGTAGESDRRELRIDMSEFAWGADASAFDLGSETLKLNMSGRALYNSSDAGPVKFTLVNTQESY